MNTTYDADKITTLRYIRTRCSSATLNAISTFKLFSLTCVVGLVSGHEGEYERKSLRRTAQEIYAGTSNSTSKSVCPVKSNPVGLFR